MKRVGLAGGWLLAAAAAYFTWSGVGASFVVPASSIIFDHKRHVKEFGLDCSHCHAAAESEKSSDLLLPKEAICLGCHNGQVAPKECAVCHRDVKDMKTYPPRERKIIFSHKSHLARQIDCLTCHPASDAKTVLTADQMPGMQTCFSCHDGTRAGSDCALCHSDVKTVRRLVHPAGFRHAHKYAAGRDASVCAPCHRQEQSCLSCHRGDNLLGSTHPVNYVYSHPLDVRSKKTDCQSCHEIESFCVSCHKAEAVQPLSHSRPNWTISTGGIPSRHAVEARRDMEYCLSCHQTDDPTCAAPGCHNN